MHSQLPTISLYLNSYARSPAKYASESTLMASPQKNRMTVANSSLISPMKDVNLPQNHNLSSLILMASPVKSPPDNGRQQSPAKQQGMNVDANGSVEMRALNLCGNIFMNSTTKFLKGFTGAANQTSSRSKQVIVSPSNAREKRQLSERKNQIMEKAALQTTSSNYIDSARYVKPGAVPVVYPSKEKIDKIVRGESNKKSQLESTASQRLQQTLTKNRASTERSRLSASKNESRSERSRSGSIQRLSRRKSRTRELKFLEKKQRSQTSITLKQTEKAATVPNATKTGLKNPNIPGRTLVNEVKSADTKRIQQKTRPNTRHVGSRPLPNAKPAEKNIETTPSILSNISEPRAAPKREGFKPIFTLPSGQLPLQTPVKPPPPLLRNDSNKSADPVQQRPMNRAKLQLTSQISTIKEEKTTDIQVKPSVKSKQIVFPGSIKGEASTYIHQNPTEVAACAVNQNGNSKFGKSQSTKAIGLSTVYKHNSNKNIKSQQKIQEAKIVQVSKPNARKLQSSKIIPLEPIPSSPSILSDKKSPQHSAISKKNLKNTQKDGLSSKISIEDHSIANVQPVTKKVQQQQVSNNKIKRSLALGQILIKFYVRKFGDAFSQIKGKYRFAKLHTKEASILLNQSANLYRNMYRNNLRASLQQLKRLSLSNPINKKSCLTLSNNRGMASSIIFRVASSKYRKYLYYLKLVSLKKLPQPMISHKQIQIQERNTNKKPYLLHQLVNIVRKYHKERIQNSLAKVIVYSANQKKMSEKQILPSVQSAPKLNKPVRDYSGQKIALSQQKQSLQYQLSRIQWRVSQKKRFCDRQKSKLLKRQEELLKKNKAMDGEVLEKRRKNKSLKGQVEQAGQQELDISLPECEPLVGILTDIYSSVFRSSQGTVDAKSLIEKHSLAKQQENRLQEEWQSLALNICLKSEIAEWQGATMINRPKKVLLAEQELIGKVLRSYMRERYLWQWVRVAAEAL